MPVQDDLDLMDARAFRDGIPHEYFRTLRNRSGLPRATDAEGNSFWYVTRHAETAAVSRQPATFSSRPTTMTSVRQTDADVPIITFLDPPEHTRMRKLTFKAFAPARLAALTTPIRQIVTSLLQRASLLGEFDLAEDVALRLPFEVLAELMGVPPEDRERVVGLARQTVNLGDPEFDADSAGADQDVFRILFDYFQDLTRRRAREPGDDLFSVLAEARIKDDRLTLDEIGTFATTLITAGSETTYSSVTGAVVALMSHPEQLAALRADRALLRGAVDEVLRWVTPVTHFARTVVTDTDLAGERLRAGERLVMWYSSANRDETVFEQPDRFDITRTPNPHLTFGGGGPHVCIGSRLAVLELQLFLESALDLIAELELTAPPVRAETNFMNTIKHLPVRLR